MPLPTSGQIAISDLRNEFGDTPGDDGLNEYYRGGAYVSWNNSNVPTSGQISLNDFRGAQNGYLLTQGSAQSGLTNFRGYDRVTVSIGSLYQNTWNGITILMVRHSVSVFKGSTFRSFTICLQGNRPRSQFGRYYDGAFGNLYTNSSSTYSQSGGNTYWSWFVGGDGYYSGSGTIRFYLYP